MRRHLSGSILIWALMTLGSAAAQPATSPISPSKAGANPEAGFDNRGALH